MESMRQSMGRPNQPSPEAPLPVEVLNWPDTGTDWTSISSLVTSIVALIVALTSLYWSRISWKQEGAVLDLRFIFFYGGHESVKDHAEYRISVINKGRSLTEISNVEIIFEDKAGNPIWLNTFGGQYIFGDDYRLDGGKTVYVELDPLKLPDAMHPLDSQRICQARLLVRHTFGISESILPNYGIETLKRYLSRNHSQS